MADSNAWLIEHSNNVFSQGGEDGVIQKILERLPEKDGWCVEFGALDGQHLSNSRNLIDNYDYSAVLIEASTKHYAALERTYRNHASVTTLNRFVGFEKEDNLDVILANTAIPNDFDLLSIDIDGNDYHVWKAFSQYRPKIVVIEFNPTIPVHIHYIQDADPSVSKGNSLKAIVALGKEKGYAAVCVVNANVIFVQAEYFALFDIKDNSPEALWVDQKNITYLFVTYDGEVILEGPQTLKWHRIPLSTRRMQHLPGYLREFPGNYSPLQRMLFALILLVKNPNEFMKQFKKRIKALQIFQ